MGIIRDRIISQLDRGGTGVAVSYNRLWKLLIDKGMTKTELRIKAGLSQEELAKKLGLAKSTISM